MNLIIIALAAVMFLPSLAKAEKMGYNPLTGDYMLYSGGLGDPQPPMKEKSKIAFEIRGAAAKALFEAMGPDAKNACLAGGDRIRKRDNGRIACLLTKQGEYFCNFGFDLKSGKSIGGLVC